jgi:hypothetical protein
MYIKATEGSKEAKNEFKKKTYVLKSGIHLSPLVLKTSNNSQVKHWEDQHINGKIISEWILGK